MTVNIDIDTPYQEMLSELRNGGRATLTPTSSDWSRTQSTTDISNSITTDSEEPVTAGSHHLAAQ